MEESEKEFLGVTDKLLFKYNTDSKIAGLNLQLERIFLINPYIIWERHVPPVHDVDFYVVLLRRMYREIEYLAKVDSRVANLKGKYKDLVKKIKIRDHFEHGVDFEKLQSLGPLNTPEIKIGKGTKIATSLLGRTIVSGDFKWDLDGDHNKFLELFKKFSDLYPYIDKKERIIIIDGIKNTLHQISKCISRSLRVK